MDKGGGGIDTSGLEEATNRAINIQQQNYEQTREDVQPWYNLGVGAVGRLSDLLGVTGGSVQDRQQIYNELLPQYTQTQTTGGANQYVDPNTGQIINISDMGAFASNLVSGYDAKRQGNDYTYSSAIDMLSKGQYDQGLEQLGYRPAQTSRDVTDYEALNAAVDSRLGSQETPDDYGSLLERFDLSKFEEDPSYQYRQEQANKALERSMAAQGVTLGGGGYGELNPQVASALQEQNQNLASMEYGNAYNRYVNDQLNIYNMLAGAAGMGQASTGQMAQVGAQTAANTAGLTTDLASAQLNAQIANQSRPSMFSTLLGGVGQAALSSPSVMSLFSDERLKDNIIYVGAENGHKIYEFDYRDGSGRFRGVMAHEVEQIEPDAVTVHPSGYKMVNYEAIGLMMERV